MDQQTLLKAYEKMYLIRRMEEEIANYFFKHRIMAFIHLYNGSEACAVGVSMHLTNQDKAFGNHRSHGHYLAKGGCPNKLFAELLGKTTGCAKSHGGSMHPIDCSVGFNGSTPLLGAISPIAAGAAFAEKFNGTGNVCVAWIGDGASEEGVVYETVNLAATWNLPYMLVIENNFYSVMTPLSDRRSKYRNNIALYHGLGANYYHTDGTDFENVYNCAADGIQSLRNGGRPVVLELFTHRHKAHSSPLDDFKIGFRKHDTKEVMEQEDCLRKMRALIVWPELLEPIHQRVEQEVKDAIAFAEQSPTPNKSDLGKYLYA